MMNKKKNLLADFKFLNDEQNILKISDLSNKLEEKLYTKLERTILIAR